MMDKWFNQSNFSKILALLISILLWAMVHLDNGTTLPGMTTAYDNKTIRDVAIKAVGLDDNYVLTAMSTDRVNLEVRGQRFLLSSFFTDDYKATVDLSGMKEGTETLPLRLNLPSGVETVSIDPSMVTVTVEKKKTKSFNVTITAEGEPAEGMKLGAFSVHPAAVNVTLAESQLEAVASVRGTVHVSGVKGNVTGQRVRLKAYDGKGQEIRGAVIEPSVVVAEVAVAQGYKMMPVRISYTGELPSGLILASVKPDTTEASVYAPTAMLSGLTGSVTAVLNLGTLEAGTKQVHANLTLPAGAELVEPKSITLEVTVARDGEVATVRKTIENVPIQIRGADASRSVTIVNPGSQTMNVSISGPEDLVKGLTNKDILLVADVKGLGLGQHDVSLQATLPKYISLVQPESPLTVTVNVQDGSGAAAAVTTPEGGTGGNSAEQNGDAGSNTGGASNSGAEGGKTGDAAVSGQNNGNPQDSSNGGAGASQPQQTK